MMREKIKFPLMAFLLLLGSAGMAQKEADVVKDKHPGKTTWTDEDACTIVEQMPEFPVSHYTIPVSIRLQ